MLLNIIVKSLLLCSINIAVSWNASVSRFQTRSVVSVVYSTLYSQMILQLRIWNTLDFQEIPKKLHSLFIWFYN